MLKRAGRRVLWKFRICRSEAEKEIPQSLNGNAETSTYLLIKPTSFEELMTQPWKKTFSES